MSGKGTTVAHTERLEVAGTQEAELQRAEGLCAVKETRTYNQVGVAAVAVIACAAIMIPGPGNKGGMRCLRLPRFRGQVITDEPLGTWYGVTHLTGPIPDALGNLTNLEVLRLFDNDLTGPILDALGRLAKSQKTGHQRGTN